MSKRYANHTALRDVNLNIPEKTIFGLLGPNGAGKTSLIRIITQITGPDTGQIFFRDEPLRPHHTAQMGYLPEERGLYKKMKVGEQLLYLAQLRGMTKADASQKAKRWIDRFELRNWLNKPVEELSKGMQQKVQFIATVLHQPSLIILDEPFSGFDPINANLLKEEILQLKEQGSTIIFSTHRMESVEELCENIALINRSEVILQGGVEQIRRQHARQTYTVAGRGTLLVTHPDFVVEKQTGGNGKFTAEIRLMPGMNPNDLLRFLIDRVEVHQFTEKVPSMNDIFIERVTQSGVSAAEAAKTLLSEAR